MIVADVIIPIFLITVVGFIIGKYKKLNIDPLVFLIIYITTPALVFSSLIETEFIFGDFFIIIFSSIIITLALYFSAVVFFRKEKSIHLPIAFGNHGFLGYPVALFAFGVEGLSKAVIYSLGGALLIYSLGVYIASNKKDIKEILKIPILYAVIIGTTFSILKINIPSIILKPISSIGDITIPLALLVLGYQLSGIRFKSIKYGILGTILKIGLGYLFALLFVLAFGITGITRNIIILESAMPAAVMSLVLYKKYNEKADAVAATVFISTLVSIITIPLILYFL